MISNNATLNEADDPFFDFDLDYEKGSFSFKAGQSFPHEAKVYLQNYLNKLDRYKNISRQGDCLWSIYQPPLPHPSGKRNISYRLKRRFQGVRVPAVATYGAAGNCQCKCAHCSADHHMNRGNRELSTSELQSAIREGVDLGVCNVILVGGEPLMRKDLEDIISSVPEEKSIVTMFSNGEYLSSERARRLKDANLFGVFFSLDSTDPSEHDTLRKRKNLFDKCREGIKNTKEAGIYTAISTYLTPENYAGGHLLRMMDLAKELGVDEVTFFDAIPTGRFSSNESICLTDRERTSIISDVKRFRQDPAYPGVSAQSCITSSFAKGFCFAGNTQFYLSSSGQFCPCDFSPLTIGTYPEKNIGQLWNDLVHSLPYEKRSAVCRMQDKTFRGKYIETIPKDAVLPYSIDNFS